jgi:hypothetical protein
MSRPHPLFKNIASKEREREREKERERESYLHFCEISDE